MAGYSLKMHREDFQGGKNILASENGLQFVHIGATLDASVIGEAELEVGQAIARNTTSGLYELFTATEGYDNFGILNVNVSMNGTDDVVVGEVIVRGTVYGEKLVDADATFRAATPLIRYV